jgi:flagellar basal body P-ring protein FlgI
MAARMRPWQQRRQLLIGLILVASSSGCFSTWITPPPSELTPEEKDDLATKEAKRDALQSAFEGDSAPRTIGDATMPFGAGPDDYMKLESVAIVNGLANTGGAPSPSAQRDYLLSELQKEDIENPNLFMDAMNTAMVTVVAYVPPGARKGDRLDLRVELSRKSNATSLKNGFLLQTRMSELAILENVQRRGDVSCFADGPVVVRQAFTGDSDPQQLREGVVIGGGRLAFNRRLGLQVRPGFKHVKVAKHIADRINSRFYFFDGVSRRGIAEAKTDTFIELDVHPRYRRNVARMMQVIATMPMNEPAANRSQWIVDCEKRLREPMAARMTAFELEAADEDGLSVLARSIPQNQGQSRFYAAEALAYRDRPEAIEPLAETARQDPILRPHAIKALGLMESTLAVNALLEMLNENSIEARYAAFTALRQRPDADFNVPGRPMVDGYKYYQIPCRCEPLVVVSGVRNAEVVAFNAEETLAVTSAVLVRDGLMVRALPDGQLAVSHYPLGKDSKQVVTTPNLSGLLGGLVEVGCSYSDAVETLRACKAEGALKAQLAVDPIADLSAIDRPPSKIDEQEQPKKGLPPSEISSDPLVSRYSWWDMRRYWYGDPKIDPSKPEKK